MKVDNKIVMRSMLYIAGNNYSLFTGYKYCVLSNAPFGWTFDKLD